MTTAPMTVAFTAIPPGELATYCVHSLTAAADLPTKAAVHRLVDLTLAGIRAPQ